LRYGFEALARDAAAAGIDGCLLTDLSVEEAGPHVESMRRAGLDTRISGRADLDARAVEVGCEILERLRLPCVANRRDGREHGPSGAVAPLVAAMREVSDLPLAVASASRGPNTWPRSSVSPTRVVGSAFVR